MIRKLAILATHPIQYHAPLFRELAARPGVELTVFYAHRPTAEHQGKGFGVAFEWDVDVTSGYAHQFLENVSRRPAMGFYGYDCPELSQILTPGRFDFVILHGWAWKCMWQAMRACRRAGIPYGVRSDSQLPRGRTGWRTMVKQCVKRVAYPRFIRRIPVCLPFGTRSAEYFRHYGGGKIVIAPHCVDNGFFAARAAEARLHRIEWRRKWEIPPNAFCFLFCGKFIPKKRPGDLIHAFSKLPVSRERPVHLLLVGSGCLEDGLRRQASELSQRVSFAGFLNQSEISAAYAASDCLVLPSNHEETWGLVVNEAMASGLPAIVSDDCGCAPDLIEEGVTGYRYTPGSVAELTEAMARMMTPAEAAKMGQEAKRRVDHDFTVSGAADVLCEVIGAPGIHP